MAWPNTGAISLSIVKSVSLTDSNDEGYNGGGAHPRVCTLFGLSVSLFAATAFGSGWSHYATACLLATRDASSCSTGEVAVCVRAPIGGRIATSLRIVQSVSPPDSNDEGCNRGGAHPHVCALLGLPVARSAPTAFGSGSPSHWLAACPRFNSLSPSRCPRSVGEECQGALCIVLVYAARCGHEWRFSKRKNSNDEGNNGGGTYPRVCALLGLPVSLSAATAFGSGWSHYATICPLATRDASSGPTGVYPAQLVCLVARDDGVRQRLVITPLPAHLPPETPAAVQPGRWLYA